MTILRFVASFMLLFIANAGTAQGDWELSKDKNGIKVYTSTDATSKFKMLKVEAVMHGTLQKLTTILQEVGNTKSWVYSTKESYVIKRFNANEILYYSQTALPWPVNDRDVAILMKITGDYKNNTLKVVAANAPNAIAEKKGIVRIPYFNATWDVKYDGANKLSIIYFLKMDPGGSVSPSVTNLFISKGPFETFTNLAELLK